MEKQNRPLVATIFFIGCFMLGIGTGGAYWFVALIGLFMIIAAYLSHRLGKTVGDLVEKHDSLNEGSDDNHDRDEPVTTND